MIDISRPVLVADDDEYFRLALTALLTGPLGFKTIIETGSLDEALDRLATATVPVSLALFDLSMPGMDGPAALGAVRECFPDVRVAVVSSSQNRNDVLTALETGVHGYILRGFGPNEMVRALGIMMSGDIFVPAFLSDLPRSSAVAGSGSQAKRRGDKAPSAADKFGTAGNKERLAAISPRQRAVLSLLVKGYSNKQIANELALGEGTVKIHVATLLRNLGVSNRTGAAAAGARLFES